LGPRADSADAKLEMYKNISMQGYVYQKDLPNDINQKQTINTIDAYFIGCGLQTDLLDNPGRTQIDFDSIKDIFGKFNRE